ncbi:ComEA family DNA-binding protein [Deinococcus sp. YIM 77859]|uniref:ComEA family DNA-binding protein n=1 Tax=Deinococcus sp. YIM 77859 TaxID=1540221 RepID=UPI000550994C|nr:ComEA family DNA-binding protein [Deinococcus sp. YIM 77859]
MLAGGLLTVAGLALAPVLHPTAPVPTVTRVALPPPAPAQLAPEYPTTASVKPLLSGRLNLNTASLEQLEALPRVGPALAARIVQGRPYRSLADLDRVKGIGPATLQVLRPLVTF